MNTKNLGLALVMGMLTLGSARAVAEQISPKYTNLNEMVEAHEGKRHGEDSGYYQ